MKKLLSLFVLIVTIYNLNAQTLEWAKQTGGSAYENSYSIAIDDAGNIYHVGYFQGTVDFDPGMNTNNLTSMGSSDIFIRKLDHNGNLIWVRQIGGVAGESCFTVKLDHNNNIYFAGGFNGTVDFDPGVGTFELTSTGNSDSYICKFDENGNFIWAKRIGGNDFIMTKFITLDNSGNVYTTGYFLGTIDFDPGIDSTNYTCIGGMGDIFISKFNSNGDFIWAKQIGGTGNNSGNYMTFDSDNKLYLTGEFSGTVDFDPGPGVFSSTSSAGSADLYICKLDSNGNFIWVKRIGGGNEDWGNCIITDTNGDLLITGGFYATTDFDPGVGVFQLVSQGYSDVFVLKLDSSGNFIWVKRFGGVNADIGYRLINSQGKIYISGNFKDIVDFDPNAGTYQLTSAGAQDVFINCIDESGNFIWAREFGGIDIDFITEMKIDEFNNIYITGDFYDTADFDPNSGQYYLTPLGTNDMYILKLKQKGIAGYVYNDINQNCLRDPYELGLNNRYVIINPGNIIAHTNESGVWTIDSLPIGTYNVTFDTSGNWQATCPVVQTFTVTNTNEITFVPDFALVSTQPCSNPEVSIYMPFMRPCFSNQLIYVNAYNQAIATGALNNVYVDVKLDSLIIPQSSSLPYTSLGNNAYRFQLGNLNPGQGVNFTINCNVSCNAELGQTLCMQANLYPTDSCVFDTIPTPYPGNYTPCTFPWDHSSIHVDGYCQNDSIYFIVTNTGTPGGGDMDCFSPVRIYIDGVWMILDSIQLTGGDTAMFVFPGDGRTWRLEADQHPLHPGNSHPNATVEACGDTSNWTSGLVNILPQNDADPVVDIYCGVVTGSYDPNDKTGYPTGVTTEHNIMPNQQLQYVIRFQNTGTDTAFTVVVRDTLDMNLDIFTVIPGVASHNYNFQMYGPRVLEWTFYNILLPDSGHNEAESHGFVTFSVNQNANLVNNTKIYNSADIYFDYNVPVITNQTMHTINDEIQTILTVKPISKEIINGITVYPNPTKANLNIVTNKELIGNEYSISDIYGRKLMKGKLINEITAISIESLAKGIYILLINGNNEYSIKVIKN